MVESCFEMTSTEQIVALLVADGRATFHAIGDQVGLSAPAAKRRVDRLVAEGTITGFTALVDPAAEGSPLEAFVELHCQGAISPDVGPRPSCVRTTRSSRRTP